MERKFAEYERGLIKVEFKGMLDEFFGP